MTISLPPKGNDAKVLGAYFSPLKVEALATPNMFVKVAEGAFWTADNEHQEFIGGTSPQISAPGTAAKWVLLTVTSNGALNLIDGAAGTSPTLPDVSLYKDQLPLAAIFVSDTVTAITNDMIYDIRPLWQVPPDSVSQTQLNDFATITFVNNGLATKAETDGTADANFTLNVGGGSINDSGIYVDRQAGPDVAIRFNELATSGSPAVVDPQWEFTNDGSTWNAIGVSAGSYYLKTELDAGALDFLYYRRTELTAGAGTSDLDSRYYEQAVADATFDVLGHTHLQVDITDLAAQVESVNNIVPTAGNVDIDLNDLASVLGDPLAITISGTTTDAVLKFDGSVYRNELLVLSDLTDVTVTTPATGEALFYNGSVFLNRDIIASDISDLASFDTDYVQTGANDASPKGAAQDIYGVKTFKDGAIVEGSLTVSGDTDLLVGELRIKDNYIDINFGEAGAGVTAGDAGIRVKRGSEADAILEWDESTDQWLIGTVGAANPLVTSSHTHTVANITDFSTGVAIELALNDLDTIQDVTYLVAPATGDHLIFNFGTGQWENTVFATDVTTELGNNNLDTLGDVITAGSPTLTSGDFLRYNGANWINGVVSIADVADFDDSAYLKITGNQTLTGDFVVDGQFATSDTVVMINDGEVGAGVAGGTGTAGVRVDRGSETDAIILWDDNTDTWEVGTIGSTVAISTSGHAHVWADITDVTSSLVEINYVTGVTSAIQTQIDAKADKVGGAVIGNFAGLDGSGNLTDSGLAAADFSATVHTHTKANITDFVEADYLHVTGDEAKTGNLILTGNLTIDGALATSDTFPILNDGEAGAGIGGGAGASGLIIDRGTETNAVIQYNDVTDQWEVGLVGSAVAITTAAHTHVAANITDFTAAADARIAAATADALSDVIYSGLAVNDFLKYNGSAWLNHVLTLGDVTDFAAGDFLHTTGNETKTGDLTIDGAFVTSDAILLLNDGEAGPGVGGGTGTAGFEIDRGAWDSSFLRWDEASGVWTITEGTGATLSTSTIVSGAHTHFLTDITDVTVSNVEVNYLNGVTGDIQPQIDNHLADMAVHLTSDQNIFLDALNLTGSPLLTAADVNQLFGVTGNVQTQIDGKTDLVGAAVVGNFAGLDAAGNLTDSGSAAADFASTTHTHTVSDVTDFAAGVTTQLNANSIDELSDVVITGPASGQILEHNGTNWINVLAGSSLVTIAGAQSITGAKTFSANTLFGSDVTVTGDLTVNGTTTSINTTNLEVADKNITVNAGYVGAPSGSTGSGLHVNRGSGSPLEDFAVLVWNDATQRWEGGIDGSETPFAVEAVTVAQPHYDIQTAAGSPANASFIVGFDVPAPSAGKASLQVFVNGIKQIEGAGKAYTVTYGVGSPLAVVVAFNSGSEPTAGADVEFYGFGYIG